MEVKSQNNWRHNNSPGKPYAFLYWARMLKSSWFWLLLRKMLFFHQQALKTACATLLGPSGPKGAVSKKHTPHVMFYHVAYVSLLLWSNSKDSGLRQDGKGICWTAERIRTWFFPSWGHQGFVSTMQADFIKDHLCDPKSSKQETSKLKKNEHTTTIQSKNNICPEKRPRKPGHRFGATLRVKMRRFGGLRRLNRQVSRVQSTQSTCPSTAELRVFNSILSLEGPAVGQPAEPMLWWMILLYC